MMERPGRNAGPFRFLIAVWWVESVVEKVVLASTGHRGTDRDHDALVQLNLKKDGIGAIT
ncbi:hypothetical protein RHIZ404_210202 [Rhizobium sp. EC-SD404]|nr:hypothetical protein RHIZ404_210202 [Rhizobium sp. EC-SD404]